MNLVCGKIVFASATFRSIKSIFIKLVDNNFQQIKMQNEDFSCTNGQIYFQESTSQNLAEEHEIAETTSQENLFCLASEMAPFSLWFEEHQTKEDESDPSDVSEEDNRANRHKKRDTQNTYRTIIRALKLEASQLFQVQDEKKFYSTNDFRCLFALVYEFRKLGQFQLIKKVLLNDLWEKLSLDQKQLPTKDQKVKRTILNLVSFEDKDFELAAIPSTLRSLKSAGQIKKHPYDQKKLTYAQFEKILDRISLKASQ